VSNAAPEILTGANAVWVNDATGHCIDSFGRLGIDIHHPVASASATGLRHNLDRAVHEL
jgi:hypothetical protein